MFLSVKNYRKISSVEIDVSKVCLLAGGNAQGKSSICQAFAATLLRNANVLNVYKKDAHLLVSDGKKKGEAVLESDNGEWRTIVSWPDMDVVDSRPDDVTTHSDPLLSGLKRFWDFEPNERIRYCIDSLSADPAKEDLHSYLKDHLETKAIDAVWGQVESRGWDGAEKWIKTTVTERKGAWREITGEAYGSKKADGWTADGKDYSKINLDASARKIEKKNEALEKLLREAGDSAAQNRRILEEIDKLPAYEIQLDEEQIKLDGLEIEHEKRLQQRSGIVSPDDNQFDCPHCNGKIIRKTVKGHVHYDKGSAKDFTPQEVREIRKEIAALDGQIENDKARKRAIEFRISELQNKIAQIKIFKEKPPPKEAANFDEDKITKARQELAEAHEENQALIKTQRAGEIHQKIVNGSVIADALSPQGVRSQVLNQRLDFFNANYLRYISENLSLPIVKLGEDMDVTCGNRRTSLLSESEKFRVNAALQIAFAQIAGGGVIIIDGADIVVGKERGLLLAAIIKAGLRGIITMSLNSPERIKPLAPHGTAYWIENGQAKEIG